MTPSPAARPPVRFLPGLPPEEPAVGLSVTLMDLLGLQRVVLVGHPAGDGVCLSDA
jgi:hypothetical protein